MVYKKNMVLTYLNLNYGSQSLKSTKCTIHFKGGTLEFDPNRATIRIRTAGAFHRSNSNTTMAKHQVEMQLTENLDMC